MSHKDAEKLTRKEEKKKKKRERENEGELNRKHKRSKSDVNGVNLGAELPETDESSKEKKRKTQSSDPTTNDTDKVDDVPLSPEPELDSVAKKSKKKKKKHEDTNGGAPEPSEAPEEPKTDILPDIALGRKRKSKKEKHYRASPEEPIPNGPNGLEDGATSGKKSKPKRDGKESVVNINGNTQDNSHDSTKVYDRVGSAEGVEDVEKKSKKHKKKSDAASGDQDDDSTKVKKKKRRKLDTEKSTGDAEAQQDDFTALDDALPMRPRTTTVFQPENTPKSPEFPFFTQTVSLYLPLYPVGFDNPITNIADQHLNPLLNHYSPQLGGVLLAYRQASFSEQSIRPRNSPTDKTPTVVASINEYAVGFGWLTVDVDLFIPQRGAFLEGTLSIQSEGHIGVVCFEKFNASIEAKRLPRGWQFVEAEGAAASAEDDPDGDEPMSSHFHSSGCWLDGSRQRVKGKIRFRIKDFDVGMAGDYGYLSIQGTMLTEDQEKELVREEMETEKQRKLKLSGMLRREARRVPEFSMTKLGREDQEEDSGQRQELYMGSRLVTPDD